MLPVFFVVTKLLRKSPWLLLAAAAVLQILPINTSDLLQSITSTLGVVSVDTYWVLIDEFCSFYVYFLAGLPVCRPNIQTCRTGQQESDDGLVRSCFVVLH